MKVLLVGNGAREHIIAEKLAQDAELYSIMSKKNPAIAQLSKEYWLCDIENAGQVSKVIAGKEFDLAFASPDATLAAGVSDVFKSNNISVASPLKAAARIEWDKSFMRTLLAKHGVRGSPGYSVAVDAAEVSRAVKEYREVAIKPLGLTGGKGVRVSGDHLKTEDEAIDYALSLLKKDDSVLIEEKMTGEEFTLQAFSDGTHISTMPPVQDHKRAFVNDEGANTGGMGSYSTGSHLPFITDADIEAAKKIMTNTVHALKKDGTPFVGVLYGQFMATATGVKVVEYNARFGDPEAVNVLSLLEDSLTDTLLSMADGQLNPPKFSNDCTVVKYMVPEGYPDNPLKDSEVSLDSSGIEAIGAKAYYASVYESNGKIFTTGSRAFAILGRGKRLEDAERMAEQGCKFVRGKVWHRSDIGTKALVQRRVDHMRNIRSGITASSGAKKKSGE